MNSAFEINAPIVSGEIIDGEAIVLHLKRGHYFSMEGSAALIWGGIERRIAPAAIADALATRFGIGRDEALQAVEVLIGELGSHDLIRAAEEPGDAAGELAGLVPSGIAYSAPRIEIFTDMEDLLLLDPIHEVDEAGWPVPPRQAQA